MNTVWFEQAMKVVRTHGCAKAEFLTKTARDNNSPGTASYAFHNAVLKEIKLIRDAKDRDELE